jgi:hypothetical protein
MKMMSTNIPRDCVECVKIACRVVVLFSGSLVAILVGIICLAAGISLEAISNALGYMSIPWFILLLYLERLVYPRFLSAFVNH